MFTAYLKTIRRLFSTHDTVLANPSSSLGFVLGVTAIVLLIFMLVPGMFSGDLFSYVSYGRISASYGDNPLLSTPADYAWYDTKAWVQWIVWRETPSAYGPAWVALAHGIAVVANAIDGDIVTHLLAHKTLAGALHLVNVVLLWKTAGIVIERYWPTGTPDATSLTSRYQSIKLAVTLTYAWNPLALIEFGVSGHNDVLIITCLLAALWLYLRGLWRAAVIAITLGGLIKLTAFIFLPGYVWLLLWQKPNENSAVQLARGGLWRATQAILLTALICVLTYAPLWQGTSTLEHLSGGPAARFFIHSLGSVVRFGLADGLALVASTLGWQPASFWSPQEIGWRLDWPARWGLLIISSTAALLATWRARTFPTMVHAWGWTLLLYLVIGSVWYWPWYATWLLIPAALLGPGRVFTAVQILCASSLGVYAVWPTIAPPLDWLTGWTGVLVTAPVLTYLGLAHLSGRRHKPVGETFP